MGDLLIAERYREIQKALKFRRIMVITQAFGACKLDTYYVSH
jgi:hypothetical protein